MPDFDFNFHIVAPILSTALGAVTLLVLDLVLPRRAFRPWAFAAALLSIFVSGWYTWSLWIGPVAGEAGRLVAFSGAFGADSFSLILNAIFLATALGAILLTAARQDELSGYFALILWATSGMMVMAGAGNLISIFLGLEILSLALYVAVSEGRSEHGAREAGFKYLVLGSTASAFLLFGFAFLFGASGTLDVGTIGARWAEAAGALGAAGTAAAGAGGAESAAMFGTAGATSDFLFQVGFLFALVGLVFKMALVPFHVWAPDVYEGAPAPVTAFMAVGTKAAAFGVLARLLLSLPPIGVAAGTAAEGGGAASALLLPLWVFGGASIVVGSVGAIRQQNMKRLLAYSSVANAGYVVVALPLLSDAGVAAATFYLFAYAFAVLGLFACIVGLTRRGEDGERVESFVGLFRRQPVLAATTALFLLSLAGIPLTGGFTGKLLILGAAAQAGAWTLAALLVIGSAISLYVYFRIVRTMWSPEPAVSAGRVQVATGRAQVAAAIDTATNLGITSAPSSLLAVRAERLATSVVLGLSVVGTVVTGLLPQWAYDVVSRVQVLPF